MGTKNSIPAEIEKKIIEDYCQGEKIIAIAAKYGVDKGTPHKIMSRHNLDLFKRRPGRPKDKEVQKRRTKEEEKQAEMRIAALRMDISMKQSQIDHLLLAFPNIDDKGV